MILSMGTTAIAVCHEPWYNFLNGNCYLHETACFVKLKFVKEIQKGMEWDPLKRETFIGKFQNWSHKSNYENNYRKIF